MKYIVERIEESIASLENMETGEITSINVSKIPFMIIEGDVLVLEETWNFDHKEKEEREERIREKMNNLWIN